MQAWEEKYYEREEGRKEALKQLIQKRLVKGSIHEIADALETDEGTVRQIIEELEKEAKK